MKNLIARKQFDNCAVKDLNLDIEEGELVGFIGPNGAGKSTVLKMLSGILYPSSGSISVLGFEPYKRKKEFLSNISIVMGQKNQLWWDLPALDTFYLNKAIYDISQKDFDNRLNNLVERLDVRDIIDVQVRKLSLGERMKMELIASLLHNPRLVLLDEPTIGLDIKSQKNIRYFLKDYNKESGSTIILTSHYMKDVQELCERVVLINHGEKVFDGNLKSLIKNYDEYKQIKISFNVMPATEELKKYGEVVSIDGYNVVISILKTNISQITNHILNCYDVTDISIDEISLEDIIEKII